MTDFRTRTRPSTVTSAHIVTAADRVALGAHIRVLMEKGEIRSIAELARRVEEIAGFTVERQLVNKWVNGVAYAGTGEARGDRASAWGLAIRVAINASRS